MSKRKKRKLNKWNRQNQVIEWTYEFVEDTVEEEEDYWKQNARVRWLEEGDANTKFFHAPVVAKRAKLAITRIKDDDGVWLENVADIRGHAAGFFKNLLTAEKSSLHRPSADFFLDYIPHLITDDDNMQLLRPVTIEEVKDGIFQMDPDSAPSADGFPGSFFRACWDVISGDLFAAVQEFFGGVPIPRSISSTLMVLIPQTGDFWGLQTH